MAGVTRGKIPPDRMISGQRRTLVEEYYASLNWRHKGNASKFLTVLGYALAQQYPSNEPREKLRMLCEREGLTVDGIHVYFGTDKPKSNTQHSIKPETLKELTGKLVAPEQPRRTKTWFRVRSFFERLV